MDDFDRFLVLNEEDRQRPRCNLLCFRKDLVQEAVKLKQLRDSTRNREATKEAADAFEAMRKLNRDWASISQIYQVKRIQSAI